MTHTPSSLPAMAESRTSSYWVEWRARVRALTRALIAVFVPLLHLWTSSLHRRRITWSTYWTKELSPPSTTSRPRFPPPRARPPPARRPPAPATLALRPPWIPRPPRPLPPPRPRPCPPPPPPRSRGTTSREYSCSLALYLAPTYCHGGHLLVSLSLLHNNYNCEAYSSLGNMNLNIHFSSVLLITY